MVSGVLGRKTTSQIGSISPTSVHVNACALATVRSRRSVTSEKPSISRTCRVLTVQPTLRTCPLFFSFFFFFYDRPRAFSSRLVPPSPPHRIENSNTYALVVLFNSMRNRKLRRSAEVSIIRCVACCDFLPFSSACCVPARTLRVFVLGFILVFRNCISMLMSLNTLTAITHTIGVMFLF